MPYWGQRDTWQQIEMANSCTKDKMSNYSLEVLDVIIIAL